MKRKKKRERKRERETDGLSILFYRGLPLDTMHCWINHKLGCHSLGHFQGINDKHQHILPCYICSRDLSTMMLNSIVCCPSKLESCLSVRPSALFRLFSCFFFLFFVFFLFYFLSFYSLFSDSAFARPSHAVAHGPITSFEIIPIIERTICPQHTRFDIGSRIPTLSMLFMRTTVGQ